MKITPVELRGVEFKRVMRGADPKEVKDYIEQAAETIEELMLENKRLSEKLEQYEKLESTIKEAAIHAQETLKAQKENAEKEAKLIIEKAKMEAERICGDAKIENEKIRKELSDLKTEREHFVAQFKSLLTLYLSLLEKEKLLKPSEEAGPPEIEGVEESKPPSKPVIREIELPQKPESVAGPEPSEAPSQKGEEASEPEAKKPKEGGTTDDEETAIGEL